MQTLREMGRAILILSSWISVGLGLLLMLPLVFLMVAIIFLSPFQFIWMWWSEGMGRGGVDHSCDWWTNPLGQAIGYMGWWTVPYILLYFASWISLIAYHCWICEKFNIKSLFISAGGI